MINVPLEHISEELEAAWMRIWITEKAVWKTEKTNRLVLWTSQTIIQDIFLRNIHNPDQFRRDVLAFVADIEKVEVDILYRLFVRNTIIIQFDMDPYQGTCSHCGKLRGPDSKPPLDNDPDLCPLCGGRLEIEEEEVTEDTPPDPNVPF